MVIQVLEFFVVDIFLIINLLTLIYTILLIFPYMLQWAFVIFALTHMNHFVIWWVWSF